MVKTKVKSSRTLFRLKTLILYVLLFEYYSRNLYSFEFVENQATRLIKLLEKKQIMFKKI